MQHLFERVRSNKCTIHNTFIQYLCLEEHCQHFSRALCEKCYRNSIYKKQIYSLRQLSKGSYQGKVMLQSNFLKNIENLYSDYPITMNDIEMIGKQLSQHRIEQMQLTSQIPQQIMQDNDQQSNIDIECANYNNQDIQSQWTTDKTIHFVTHLTCMDIGNKSDQIALGRQKSKEILILRKNKIIQKLIGHLGSIQLLKFNHNTTTLASYCNSGILLLWNYSSNGKWILQDQIECSKIRLDSIEFNSDSSLFALCDVVEIRIHINVNNVWITKNNIGQQVNPMDIC